MYWSGQHMNLRRACRNTTTKEVIGASLSEPHQTSCWLSSLAAILDRRRRTFNFWSALISFDQPALSFSRSALPCCRLHASFACMLLYWFYRPAHARLHVSSHAHGQLAWAGLDARAGRASMTCIVQGTTAGRVLWCRDICSGIRSCLSTCSCTWNSVYGAEYLLVTQQHQGPQAHMPGNVSTLASALRLHGCSSRLRVYTRLPCVFTLLKI